VRRSVPVIAAIAAAFCAFAALPSTNAGASAASPRHRVDRVLILSLPAVSWAELGAARAPNLDRLLDASAIADLSTRAVHKRTDLADGYMTIGAGARAVAPVEGSGLGFDVEEPYGADPAGLVYQRRTGRQPGDGLVDLSIAPALDANKKLLFDAKVGALGDALARAGVGRAVVANADEGDLVADDARFVRPAVTALMGTDGRVPTGRVGGDLLMPDSAAPFGRRLDPDAVLSGFRRVWEPRTRQRARSVVLVEASDVARADAYRQFAAPGERDELVHRALRETDELVGRILARVDRNHDAVLVVGPAHPDRQIQLTVAGLWARHVRPGLLRSGTTRRSGFVQIVDVGPTVLDLLGVERPDSMEGRPFTAGRSGGSATARRDFLVDADRAARFRDANVSQVVTVFVLLSVLLAAAAVGLVGRRWRGTRGVLEWASLWLLGFMPATFLARLVPFYRYGVAVYWIFLAVVALAFAAGCELVGRRGPLIPLVAALSGVVALHVADVLTGAHFELDTVFGYTPTVGIRIAGIGNMAYSQLAAAAVLLAGLLAHVLGGRRGAIVATAMLGVVLVTIGAPFFGQNFGGALATAPAFAVVVLLLFGRRITARLAIALAGLLVATGVVIGLVDLTRPSGSRTHVGRFFEKVDTDGWHGFSVVIRRKLAENLDVLNQSRWFLMVPAILAFVAYLMYRSPPRLRAMERQVPPLRPALAGFLVASVLGLALKDSGIAVPGMMLGVLDAVLVYLTVRLT
jgi:hypothetical protein